MMAMSSFTCLEWIKYSLSEHVDHSHYKKHLKIIWQLCVICLITVDQSSGRYNILTWQLTTKKKSSSKHMKMGSSFEVLVETNSTVKTDRQSDLRFRR